MIETMDRDELLGLQFKKLLGLLESTAQTNPFYRDRWNQAGVKIEQIKTLQDFTAMVPTVEKADFVADQNDCPPLGKRHQYAVDLHCPMIFTNTSGTSGQGVEIHAQTATEFRTTEIYAHVSDDHIRDAAEINLGPVDLGSHGQKPDRKRRTLA